MNSKIPLIALLSSIGIVAIVNSCDDKEITKSPPSIVYLSPEEKVITLAAAKADSTKRQAYLDKLVAASKIPFCNGIVYDNDGSKILRYTKQDLIAQNLDAKTIDSLINARKQDLKERLYLAITPHSYFTRGRDESGKIFIGPDLFDREAYQIDGDYKATIAHEARHLLQHAKGLPFDYLLGENKGDESKIKELIFKGELRIYCFEMVGELDAYYETLQRIQKKEFLVSDMHLESIINNYRNLRKTIERNLNIPASSTEELFLTAVLDRMKEL
ncbi:hypothetical protein HZA96_05615 [Candidatus Woesearchaeota archaeon]|nr:hypothetical protein [Candidatus Woesearchaeota archaeon]